MFFDVNKLLCETFPGINPITLLDYPAEDVFNLINGLTDYNRRSNKQTAANDVIRKRAGDDWF